LRGRKGLLGRLIGTLAWWAARVALPRLMDVNAATAARGTRRLLEEFDFFDALISAREAEAAAEAKGGDGGGGGEGPAKLPFYLCGPSLSAADVSLAVLATPVVRLPPSARGGGRGGGGAASEAAARLPREFTDLVAGLTARPTGQYVVRLWEAHGPEMAAAAEAAKAAARAARR
jgi:hypothetical protein